MTYPEKIVLEELMWEYDYTQNQAQFIIDQYKSKNRYSELCDLIQHKLSTKLSEKDLYTSVGGSDV